MKSLIMATLAAATATSLATVEFRRQYDPVNNRVSPIMVMMNGSGQSLAIGCQKDGDGSLWMIVDPDRAGRALTGKAASVSYRFGKEERPRHFEWFGDEGLLWWDDSAFASSTDKALFLDRLAKDGELHFRYETFSGARSFSFYYAPPPAAVSSIVKACAPKKVIRKLREIGSPIET